jgi:hypothetical protein
VIGIYTNNQNMGEERNVVILKYNLTYPILLDKNPEINTLYSISGIQNLLVINQKKEIIQHKIGLDND